MVILERRAPGQRSSAQSRPNCPELQAQSAKRKVQVRHPRTTDTVPIQSLESSDGELNQGKMLHLCVPQTPIHSSR
jgi:hypothetical protein